MKLKTNKKTKDLQEAVNIASEDIFIGKTVLFSPMCASFDMFDNFKHRGIVFKKIVGDLSKI